MREMKTTSPILFLVAISAATLAMTPTSIAFGQWHIDSQQPPEAMVLPPPLTQQTPQAGIVPPGYTQFNQPFFGLTVSYPDTWVVREPYNTLLAGEKSIFQVFESDDFTGDTPNVNFELNNEWIPGMAIKT
jgi:hypothetical protein